MALKPDRNIEATELRFYHNGTASKGQILCHSDTQVGSGVAMDAQDNVAVVVATAAVTSKPIGLLLQDVVNIDQTRTPINWHQDQAASGDKVTLLRKGWVVTDQVDEAHAGSGAQLANSGKVASYNGLNPIGATTVPVGRFVTGKDQNGFATLYVDL